MQKNVYLCALKGWRLRLICRKRAAEPYHDIDKVAFAIYSLTYLETWEISMCIAQVQWMSTRSLLICTYTSVCVVLNKGRMPARRRGRFVVWRYGYSQDLKVWTRNRSCLFCVPNCQRRHENHAKTPVLTALKRKRTNKNQSVSCLHSEKTLPLQSKTTK